ncbi:MAG: DUF4919 domain-containing protein [Bacteroidia bacterium]
MKKLISLLLAMQLAAPLLAQQISRISFDSVFSRTSNPELSSYYPKLLERFFADDSLHASEYALLYYGATNQSFYTPYGSSANERLFNEHYRDANFALAIPFGDSALHDNPINLRMLFRMLVAHHEMGNQLMAHRFAKRYFGLLQSIYDSGDGKSIETAWVVIAVSDEYMVLHDLELQSVKQSLIRETDVLQLDTRNQPAEEKIEALYFNVSMPLRQLSKMMAQE